MPLYLTILEGPTPAEAHPLLATHDPAIIRVVRQLLMDRLAEAPDRPLRRLTRPRPVAPSQAPPEGAPDGRC